MTENIRLFFRPFTDGRYEDLLRGNIAANVARDLTAGLIVAMVAIPLAMGFAMASGLRPEQGIVGGAVAGLVGALFGGSKYQVYGPTAAFIPIIAAIVAMGGMQMLIVASILAGVILALFGFLGMGRYVQLVPHSIVVGFTIGIAGTIALSQAGEVLGFHDPLPYVLIEKIEGIAAQYGTMNLWALLLAVGTVVITRLSSKISVFVPGPIIALGLGTLLAATVLSGEGLSLVSTKYGSIPARAWSFTPPTLPESFTAEYATNLTYAVLSIVFVCAIESLLCSRMADRLANNKGTPFIPDKELFGQGIVNIVVVLFNGFPHTGALARTATNIKLGAVSPLAGIAKFVFKLMLAFYLASWLELVPMACIGGILLFVAMNMVKREEIDEVLRAGRGETMVMAYTAITVLVSDFLTGVISALVIYAVARWAAPNAGWAKPHAAKAAHAPEGPRARRKGERADPHSSPLAPGAPAWRRHIRQRATVPGTAYVHPQATLIGRVVLGDFVHVAAGTSIRADEGAPFYIGESSNVQDGVIIHALKDRYVEVDGERWAVWVGRNVSIAHGAIVHGPSFVGDDTFIGFKATVHDSVVGRGCAIGHSAVVVGVEIPDGKRVPHGAIVDSPEKVAALPEATPEQAHFNVDVVEVNRGLASAYRAEERPAVSGAPPQRVVRVEDRF